MVSKFLPVLKTLGMANENSQLLIEPIKEFMSSGFDHSGSIMVNGLGIEFVREDGQALVNLLEKHRDA